MDTLKQRIFDYICANQPVTIKQIRAEIGLSMSAVCQQLSIMKDAGMVISAVGAGYFTSKEKLSEWRSNPDEEFMMRRAIKGGFAAARLAHASGKTHQSRIEKALSDGKKLSLPELSAATGSSTRQLSTAISKMVKMGQLNHVGKIGHRVYYLAEIWRYNSVNTVFDECKRSDSHRRLMMIYGRAGV